MTASVYNHQSDSQLRSTWKWMRKNTVIIIAGSWALMDLTKDMEFAAVEDD